MVGVTAWKGNPTLARATRERRGQAREEKRDSGRLWRRGRAIERLFVFWHGERARFS